MTKIEQLIETNDIYIVSGEGEVGTSHAYTGTRSMRAIRCAIMKERCGGDRWAKAIVLSHMNGGCPVYINFENGEYC